MQSFFYKINLIVGILAALKTILMIGFAWNIKEGPWLCPLHTKNFSLF